MALPETLHGTKRASVALVFALLLGTAANAELRRFEATVQSEVQRFLGGEPTDYDEAFKQFPGVTTSNLPMTAEANLVYTDGEGTVTALGNATTTFSDPRRSEDPSPEEFGLVATAFSNDASFSHEVRGKATETRDIVFTAADIGRPDGTAIRVRSRFFVDGIMVIWAAEGVTDIRQTTASVRITITQKRPDAEPVTVLETEIKAAGTADGKTVLFASGAVQPENLGTFEVTGAAIGAATGTEVNFGTVRPVQIPETAIPYEYDTAVGESFQLTATVEVLATDQAGGHGAAVALGLPLEEIGRYIDEATQTHFGTGVVNLIEIKQATTLRPQVPLRGARGIEITVLDEAQTNGLPAGLPALCGPIGVESFLMLAAMGCFLLSHSRRRR